MHARMFQSFEPGTAAAGVPPETVAGPVAEAAVPAASVAAVPAPELEGV